ncbi:hypothetical protein ACQEVB_22520 [Pseudonocardia sp. CA-107938]|uniref:hypothetical protein n=1 Tax=Pseudonocardia sp. CA-107938 TaxID=3240021 RepID=UPI003D8DA0C1
MTGKWFVWLVFAGFSGALIVVPGILMIVRGRAYRFYRYITVGWRWKHVDLTSDETRTLGWYYIALGVLYPGVALAVLSLDEDVAPSVLTGVATAASAATFVWAIVLSRRVRRLPSVVAARRPAAG